jgi:hypothetical protein
MDEKKLIHFKSLHAEMHNLKKKILLANMNNENTKDMEKRLNEIIEDLGFNHDEDSKAYKKHKTRFGHIDKKESWYRDAPSKTMKIFGGGGCSGK